MNAPATAARLEVQITPGALVLLGLIPLFGWRDAWVVVGCILLHECGHWAAARLCGVPVQAIGLCALGGFTRRAMAQNANHTRVICLAGPAASLLLFVIFGFTSHGMLAAANLIIAVSNLLPVPGTDGWRALNARGV